MAPNLQIYVINEGLKLSLSVRNACYFGVIKSIYLQSRTI